jgi:hypothetical protein
MAAKGKFAYPPVIPKAAAPAARPPMQSRRPGGGALGRAPAPMAKRSGKRGA